MIHTAKLEYLQVYNHTSRIYLQWGSFLGSVKPRLKLEEIWYMNCKNAKNTFSANYKIFNLQIEIRITIVIQNR